MDINGIKKVLEAYLLTNEDVLDQEEVKQIKGHIEELGSIKELIDNGGMITLRKDKEPVDRYILMDEETLVDMVQHIVYQRLTKENRWTISYDEFVTNFRYTFGDILPEYVLKVGYDAAIEQFDQESAAE